MNVFHTPSKNVREKGCPESSEAHTFHSSADSRLLKSGNVFDRAKTSSACKKRVNAVFERMMMKRDLRGLSIPECTAASNRF